MSHLPIDSIVIGGSHIHGTSSVADAKLVSLPIRAYGMNESWQIITGANVSVVAHGRFT